MRLGFSTNAKRTFIVSQVALLCFSLLYYPATRHPQFHPDLVDGLRGFFLGVAIVMMILTARNRRRA